MSRLLLEYAVRAFGHQPVHRVHNFISDSDDDDSRMQSQEDLIQLEPEPEPEPEIETASPLIGQDPGPPPAIPLPPDPAIARAEHRIFMHDAVHGPAAPHEPFPPFVDPILYHATPAPSINDDFLPYSTGLRRLTTIDEIPPVIAVEDRGAEKKCPGKKGLIRTKSLQLVRRVFSRSSGSSRSSSSGADEQQTPRTKRPSGTNTTTTTTTPSASSHRAPRPRPPTPPPISTPSPSTLPPLIPPLTPRPSLYHNFSATASSDSMPIMPAPDAPEKHDPPGSEDICDAPRAPLPPLPPMKRARTVYRDEDLMWIGGFDLYVHWYERACERAKKGVRKWRERSGGSEETGSGG